MKPERWRRLRSLYEDALEQPASERDAWLRAACAGDAELLGEARGMVAASAETATGGANSTPFLDPLPRPTEPIHTLRPGTRVGSFELGPLLATGGMGSVYEAWQAEPRRKVALKLLHSGLGSDSALRRFRFEAELLARLQHPGIAPIHEAGVHATQDGLDAPYIAMEFVEGASDVVTHARGVGLSLAPRLELMLQVCAAVQHGHQQGVVHRDLKPQNILVDAAGRVRVIDFGIARTIGGFDGAAPDTRLTGAGEILGTLAYMSPEQFAGDSTTIDTRSDVYALGVVIHELVCDRPPYELRGRSLVEITRIVSDREVPLPREVPADLGWIVLKALAKEPAERYPSASELAADLERFLADAPVEAGAPSSTYRLKKFVRRNRVAVLFSGLAAAALLIGAVTAFVGLVEAREAQAELADERDVARAAAGKFASISDVLGGLFLSVTPDQDGRDVRVADLLHRASQEFATVDDPEVAAALRRVIGRAYGNLGLLQEALSELEAARTLLASTAGGDPRQQAELRADLVRTLTAVGRSEEALDLARSSLAEATLALGRNDPGVFELTAALCAALVRAGQPGEAIQRLERSAPEAVARLGGGALVTLDLHTQWGRALAAAGRFEEARDTLLATAERAARALGPDAHQALEARYLAALQVVPLGRTAAGLLELEALIQPFERTFGVGTSRSCQLMAMIADLMVVVGRDDEAYTLLEATLPCLEATLDPSSMDLITARANLAALLDRMGDEAGALAVRRAAWQAAQRWFGPDDPRTLKQEMGVAVQLEKEGDPQQSLELATHVAEQRQKSLGESDLATLEAREIRGNALMALGRWDEALEIQRDVFDRLTRVLGPDGPMTIRLQNAVTSILAHTGQIAEALKEGERMLAAHRRAMPDSDPSRVILLTNLGLYAFDMGQMVLSCDYLEQAYEHANRHLPEDDFDRLQAPLNIANVLRVNGQHETALSYLREATEALKRRPGSHLELRIRAHGGIGLSLAALGQATEARAELEVAYALADQTGQVEMRDQLALALDALPD